jgi:cysteinyl-tRNA synthetase
LSLRIYDTRLRRKVPFVPLEEGRIGMYSCGVTVYDLCHVGHARMMVAFDVIARYLRESGYALRYVRNITDVDDKIIRRANAEGESAATIAQRYIDAMNADMGALGIAPADAEPRATENIDEVLEVVRRLEGRDLAYAAGGDVYYAVAGFPRYGQLSGQSIDDLKAGARIEVGESKRSPLDFALWKGAKPGEPQWESPWGSGRPGWHIECSAMAHRYLGETFDIHGGGSDLEFPHHENEIAQSEGAFGDGHFARHWLHSGMVTFSGEKMSKSLGNVVTIRRVAETHDLEALRLLFVSVHYRSPVAFSIVNDAEGRPQYPELDDAEGRLEYFYRTFEKLDLAGLPAGAEAAAGEVVAPADRTRAAFREAMDDDFNTAAARPWAQPSDRRAACWPARTRRRGGRRRRTLARLRGDLHACGETLGIFRRPAAEFLLARRTRLCARRHIDPAAVEARIAERAAARAAKDFARADEIRKALHGQGIELMDTPGGTTWRVLT